MRFDWYQATIEAPPVVVIETIAKLGQELRPADALARKYRYQQGLAVHDHQRGVVAHIFAGGNGKNPHAFASGEATEDFVGLVRGEWPERHLVTRMDAAEDFNEEGSFDRLRPVLRKIAKRHRLSFPKIEDDLNDQAGRTQYVGSPSSDYRARLYEKGFEQLARMAALYRKHGGLSPESVIMIRNEHTGDFVRPEDWTRLELQVRPRQEEGKRKAAEASPDQAWGFTEWAHDVAVEALTLDLERICIRTRKISKDEEAMRWMCQHYGKMLSRLRDDLGCWEGVGVEIGRILSGG